MEILNRLKNLDAYPKINEDFYNRTLSGGLITIFSSIAMLLLFFSEFRLYLNAVTESKLTVDTSRGETLRINFDVTFPALACSLVSIDAMDISGEQHYDIRHDIIKKRIDHEGNVIESRTDGIGAPKIERPLQRHGGRLDHNETYCGSCFGAEVSDSDCCNSCEEVREAYQKKGWAMTNPDMIDQIGRYVAQNILLSSGPIDSVCFYMKKRFSTEWASYLYNWYIEHEEINDTSLDLDSPACKREGFIQKIKEEDGEGCNMHGFVEVNKVAGNFHFTPGKSFHQASLSLFDILASFQTENFNISHKINKLSFGEEYPGFFNPLDGVQWTQQTSSGMYQYFIKVVPTIYTNIRGRKINSNQFSVTEHFRSATGYPQPLPGVFFFYDFSPIKVAFSEEKVSLLHFLTNVCAIIGGIFTVAGIVDAFVYHGQRAIKNKMALGKYG